MPHNVTLGLARRALPGVAFLALVPSLAWLQTPVWRLRGPLLYQAAGLCVAYLLWVAFFSPGESRDRIPRRSAPLTGAVAVLAAYYAFILLLLAPYQYSRGLVLVGSVSYLALVFAPRLRERWHRSAIRTAGGGVVALVALGMVYKASRPGQLPPPRKDTILYTQRHAIQAIRYPLPSAPEVAGGGLAKAGQDYLLVQGDGSFYLLRWHGDSLALDSLPLRAPLNLQEFREDVAQDPHRRFRVAGILTRDLPGDSTLVIVSHHFWRREEQCFSLRLSRIRLHRTELDLAHEPDRWKLLYETSPCLPVRDRPRSFPGQQAGGRMAWLGDSALIVTVGDHEFDGWWADPALPQERDNDYGKTLLVSLEGGARMFTLGHRNPQGLYVEAESLIWLTEHGPKGGDELNLLIPGGNYGWPFSTYGTAYESVIWPLQAPLDSTGSFVPPVFAWVPSIGISNLIVLTGSGFSRWTGDLLVSSLNDRSLYRLHREGHRIVYAEPIRIGLRIRDLIEDDYGRIVLWTDEGVIAVLRAFDAFGEDATSALLSPCVRCHTFTGSTHGPGPDLLDVYGRLVASAAGFAYSSALRRVGGRWTDQRLDAFLQNPQSFAPGTTMIVEGIPEARDRAALIQYLKRLRSR